MEKIIKFRGGGILFADKVEYVSSIHTPMHRSTLFSAVPTQYQFKICTIGNQDGYDVLFSDRKIALCVRDELVLFLKNNSAGIFDIEYRENNL